MLLAKKEGYTVIFVPDYPSLFYIGKENYNLDTLESQFEQREGTDEPMFPYDEYYRAGLDSFNANAKNPAGFSFMSWTGTGMVRGTKAAPLLKEFLADMK